MKKKIAMRPNGIRLAYGSGPRVRTARRLVLSTAAFACLALAAAEAQELPGPIDLPDPPGIAAPAPQFGVPRGYQTVYQHETAREYLQRRAQAQAEARQARIEGMRWLGYSPLRPTAASTPFISYSPSWGAFHVGSYWSHPYWHHSANFAR